MSDYGQLGKVLFQSKYKDIREPVRLMSDMQAVTTGGDAVFALKKDHTLWSWGGRGLGNRGDNDKQPRADAKKILDKVSLISASKSHALALRDDGTLWSWGWNPCGGLGNDTTDDRDRPGKVNMENFEGRKIVNIATRFGESFAITEDGLLWHWGAADKDCEHDSSNPLQPERLEFIDNVQDVAAISVWHFYMLALKKDGTVWAWGIINAFGLPEGRGDNPLQVLSDVEEISVGQDHALALKKDGTVWVWGNNNYGQLGNQNKESNYVPTQLVFPQYSTTKAR